MCPFMQTVHILYNLNENSLLHFTSTFPSVTPPTRKSTHTHYTHTHTHTPTSAACRVFSGVARQSAHVRCRSLCVSRLSTLIPYIRAP